MIFRDFDGKIIVGNFRCTTAQFAVIETDYTGLPFDIAQRDYNTSSGRHILKDTQNKQLAGELPYPLGDTIISRQSTYQALLDAAFPAPPIPPPDPKRKAPSIPSGNSVPQMRAELALLRQVLIDAGYLDE